MYNIINATNNNNKKPKQQQKPRNNNNPPKTTTTTTPNNNNKIPQKQKQCLKTRANHADLDNIPIKLKSKPDNCRLDAFLSVWNAFLEGI